MSGWNKIGGCALFPSRYLASVGYYAALSAYDTVVIDAGMRFDKRQKSVHRCRIADTHGETYLTVPIEKPVSMTNARWKDIMVSGHGNWWHVHWETLQSAYGRTPFFEYYADDFASLFTSDAVSKPLVGFNQQLDELLRKFFQITTAVSVADSSELENVVDDFRLREPDFDSIEEYYQVRAAKHGFLASLSAVDLLFNMGPESPLILSKMSSKLSR